MKNIMINSYFIFRAAFRIDNGLTRNTNSPAFMKIGHRGAAGYCPENTFASFKKAIDLGAEYLEIDVQMTKDGELVVIHDPTVNRTTNGKGRVRDLSLAEIQALDAGSWFNPIFAGEKIPSFSEFLDVFAGNTCLLIELKKPSLYPQIEEKVANELMQRGITSGENNQVIVQSFDRNSMKRFHELLPDVPIGILVKNRGVNGLSTKDLKSFASYATYVNPKITMVNKRLLKRIHHHGFKTIIWTVKKKKEIRILKQFKIDGVVSDYPDFL